MVGCLVILLLLLLVILIPNSSTSSLHRGDDPATKPATTSPPNVLLILADDIGTGDVPGYWTDTCKVDMPNFEEFLASEGTVIFTDAHSTPLCAPSRYLLLSGNYPHRGRKRNGVWRMDRKGSQFRHGQRSLAHVLRHSDANYHTFMAGKWVSSVLNVLLSFVDAFNKTHR